MHNTTDNKPVADAAGDSTTPAPSQVFLEAILYKDAKVLRGFGVDDKAVQGISLDKQVEVAMKLLAADNNLRRSQSKRVQAAVVLGDKSESAAPLAGKGKVATFQTSATFNPKPSATLKAV